MPRARQRPRLRLRALRPRAVSAVAATRSFDEVYGATGIGRLAGPPRTLGPPRRNQREDKSPVGPGSRSMTHSIRQEHARDTAATSPERAGPIHWKVLHFDGSRERTPSTNRRIERGADSTIQCSRRPVSGGSRKV